MKTNIAAPLGGALLLVGGIALAAYTASSADTLKQTQAKTIQHYLSLSDKALSEHHPNEAESWIHKALVVDPTNKQVLQAYRKAVLATCPTHTASAPTTTPATGSTTPPPATPPQQPEAETEDEMGCI